MHDREDTRLLTGKAGIAAGSKDVLTIPRFNSFFVPDFPAQVIHAGEAVSIKKFLPVGRPLAINMMLAMLARAGGSENYNVRMAGE